MKKIFTHLLAVFMLSLLSTSAWAESFTVTPGDGSYNSSANWASVWTSSSSDNPLTISVNANNLKVGAVGTDSNGFGLASGTAESSTWSFTVNGYKILSYSFKYELQSGSTATDIVITVNEEAHSVTSTTTELLVENVNSSTATFTLSGTNEYIIITNLSFTVEPLFESGKVYRFENVGDATRALSAAALTDAGTAVSADDDRAQQWLVTAIDGGNYTLCNLANGRYLEGNNSTSGGWALTEASNEFSAILVSGNYCLRGASHTNGYAYMHRNGSNDIVSWETSSTSTQWTKELVEYTDEDLQAVWDEVEALVVSSATVEGYQTKLDAMFTDRSCTKLNDTYAAKELSAIQSDANYTGLPAVLQAMVEKVYNEQKGSTTAWEESAVAPDVRPNGNSNINHSLWTVEDTWENDYAKKFRVQMYEPYSIEGEITSFLRFNAHCNMDNPTGIYANSYQAIYIMVEGEIAEGAELWVAHQIGHGATYYYNNTAYTKLKEGLNIVPYFADGSHMWINYVVHTYDSETGTFPHKLSDYKPLKIHIEGGYINGFFNAMGDYRSTEVSGDVNGGENLWGEVDNDEDWNYYKARAALSGDFVLLGHRQTLLFDFGTYNSDKGHFGVANADGGIEYALAYHLENISVPTTPNCYGGTKGSFGTYAGSYSGMNLDASTGKINIMLEAWDRIMYSEHATMGLLSQSNIDKMNALYPGWASDGSTFDIYNYGSATVDGVTQTYEEFCEGRDYSDYYNHHGAAVGAGSGYMSGGWRVCNYHYNTMGSIIGKIALEAGPTWGPAHEIGHQHQGVFNLNGQTEVTNNFFSNVAVWYMGMGTSRYNGSEGNLEHVLEAYNTDGNDLYTNNIWAITHLYYRLWLYYHLAGNNTQFWPRLFELCRQQPIMNGTQISGETSLLRFYQHACNAAGEDLTEFFRAHGYFELMTDRLVGDYSNGTYNVTEEQIETAITAIEAEGYPKNYAILLINDGTEDTTVKHDGTTKRSLWDGSATADYGSVTDFIEGNTSVTTAYEATVSADGTVTMSGGEGGVGFLIFNEDGELVSFSNNSTFEISDEAAYLLATGKATISTVDAESNTTEAEVDLTAIQSSLISSLINDVDEILKYVDDTHTKVGYYKASAVKDLQAALATAKETLETGEGIAVAYEILYTEYRKVMDNDDAKVAIISGAKYAIKSKSGSDYMDVDDSGNVTTTNSSTFPTENSDLWIIEVVSADTYNIKNASTGKYLQQVSDENSVNFTVGDNAVNYKITNVDNVLYAFSTTSYSNRYMDRHSATQVATWGTDISNNAKWWITLADDDVAALSVSTAELQALIEKTENLVGTLATVEYAKGTPFELQTTQSGSPYYVYTNAQQADEGPIANLVDGDVTNYFHTNWANGIQTPGSHYIIVDLGASNSLDMFMFSCTARNGGDNQDVPSGINIFGSNDNSAYSLITDDVNPDFALTKGEYWETVDPVVATQSYRYLRFNVYANRGYWAMAEFDLYPVSLTVTLLSAYAEYSAILETSLISDAHNGVELGKAWLNYDAATSAEIEAYTETLQEKYDALYAAYKQVIDSEKAKLQSIIDDTEGLITQVGTATVIADADIDLLGKLYAERVYDADTGSSDYSTAEAGYNLLDGDVNTHFHSDYVFSTMVSPPYIRVDLGDGNTASKFEFNYTTRNQTGCAPTTLNVYGSNEQDDNYTLIKTFTSSDSDNPLPTAAKTSWTSSEVTSATAYRYFKFEVAVSESGKTESGVKKYYFAISEFGFRKLGEVSATINQEYESIVSESLLIDTRRTVNASETMVGYATDYVVTVEQLEAQITKLTEAKVELEAAMNQVDKSGLISLIDEVKALYDKMTDDNGNMNADYATSELTAENLATVKTELAAAQNAVDNATTQLEVNTAKANLETAYKALTDVEDTNVESTLETTGLTTLIADVKALLGTIATEKASSKVALPLQTTESAQGFYITTAGVGDGSLANLIDKNADGTGNTGTYYGSLWQGTIDPFSQYVQVDLGTGIALDKFLFDYTTRDSNHATERPTLIKIQGSNDGTTFVDIAEVSDGMPVGKCEQWVMANAQELAARYRYIRFAVKGGTETTTVDDVTTTKEINSFHMSDFNLYAYIDYVLNEYYTTATGLGFVDLCVALQSAEDLLTRDYVTTEQYNTVLAKLQACYDTTNGVVTADYKTRTALETLIADTETLINKLSTVTEVAAVTLSVDNLYCNADNSTNADADGSDKLGVAALLDGDVSTHLHTTYGGNAQDDDFDHYIRVDVGADNAVAAFEFNYTGRKNNTNNAPTDITVQGCNTENGDWVDIVTLTDMSITEGVTATYESGIIEASEAYRYIRFMVKGTKNNDITTYNDKTHKFFVMSEFGFTAYPTVEIGEGHTNVTTALVRTAYDEKNSATVAKEFYMNETDYNAVLDELQAAYDALETASIANKSELEALIKATTILKAQLYKYTFTTTEVTLQNETADAAGYLYCNAPETNSSWDTDNVGVAALIDLTTDGEPDLATFLHTEYGSDQSADGLDHYLRVDLGESGATEYIEFGYFGRSEHLAKSPKTVIVQATNDLTDGGDWTTITNLSLAQASASTETKTGCLGYGVAYRYWRFLVKESYFGGKDGNGHPYFCMTQFNVYKCDVTDSSLKYDPTIYVYTTTELVTEVDNAITAANVVIENTDADLKQGVVDDAVVALQAVHDKLAFALKHATVPVELTADENNPVLYKIISKRADDDSKVLQFDEPTTDKVAIVGTADNASYQAWYFMEGTNGYLIKPFNGMGKKLGVKKTSDAQASASIAEAPAYSEWNFARSTVDGCTDYFYIYVDGTSYACLSHNGGFNETDKLGIWSSGWNTYDGGTLFKFIEAEFDNDNARFYQLSDFENTLEYRTSVTPEGTTVGAFVNGAAYSEAYTIASALISTGNTSDATACYDAYTALRAASETVERILPEAGKVYTIKVSPGLTDDARAGAYMRIDDAGKLYCDTYSTPNTNARFYFEFEYDSDGNLYMKNLHSGTYLDEALTTASNKNVQVGADAESLLDEDSNVLAKSIAINTLGATSDGSVVVGIVPTGGDMLNCAAKPGNVVAYNNTAVDKASAWVIEEVDDISGIKHDVTMKTKFSSVMLNYNVTVPAGVEAYNAEGIEGGYVTLVKIADADEEDTEVGNVIPANTPVILYIPEFSAQATMTFNYTESTVDGPVDTYLGGSLYTKYVECDDADYYKLMIKNNEAKMYLMYKEFNAEGVSQGANHNGGHIKCSANKIYMRVPAASGMASFGMRFATPGTTGIDEVTGENAKGKEIYDLTGRKLNEITESGFYIVNGKKVYVK